MPNDPIMADDGGSTRVKRVELPNGKGKMQELEEASQLNASGKPYDGKSGSQQIIPKKDGPYGTLRVTYLDREGTAREDTRAFTSFLIISGDQKVMGEVVNGGDLQVTAFSDVGEPSVDVKQHKKKRRYVITNAPPIEEVKVDGTLVLDIPGRTFFTGGRGAPVEPVIYTCVVAS